MMEYRVYTRENYCCANQRDMSDFQKNCQLKEEVFKGAVKNMIIVEKSLLWCTLLHGRSR